MSAKQLPSKKDLTICFAHPAYQLGNRFKLRNTGINYFEVRNLEHLQERLQDADVLVVSGLWRNEFVARFPRLAYIQSISAGLDQYSKETIKGAGIRLASAQGVNERAVAEHAMGLILASARKIPMARDNQAARKWRGLISDLTQREDELGGKTVVIVGMGRIGSRLATLAKAFDMRVIGVKRDVASGIGKADLVVPHKELRSALGQADFVVLTCPLTPETENLLDADAIGAMRASAYLINVARGPVVNEEALIDALETGRIAGAAIDCARQEPLPESSRLWAVPNLLITPHSAGETRKYEDNVIDILMENLGRQWRDESVLVNQVV
jgi:D-2-hydroxyacid dehydrogenase (NADP+)